MDARAPLADAKVRAHRAFDAMWQGMGMQRHDAYRWLAKQLGLTTQATHIRTLSIAQCDRVVRAVERTLAQGRQRSRRRRRHE